MITVEMPKGAGAVRPGAVLTLTDEVVYTALVGAALVKLKTLYEWKNNPPDQSCRLRNASGEDWIESRFFAWRRFHDISLKELRANTNYAVITDLVGCYENIDLRTLFSDLTYVGVPAPVIQMLTKLLGRWSGVRGRGLPQGYSASDLLAKVYLTRIDLALSEAEYSHVRYVDDFRIFCKSRAEAKRALLVLQGLARQRGLNVQSKKTDIFRVDEAQEEIDSLFRALIPVIGRYKREVAAMLGLDAMYMTERELQVALSDSDQQPPTEVLRGAYQAYFVETGLPFNRSLFHYLLNRLAKAKDDFAVDHSLTLLDDHPEETDSILAYVEKVDRVGKADQHLLKYLESDDSVYPYQHYQVIRWRARVSGTPSEAFLGYVRRQEDSSRAPAYLRSSARMLLARFGSAADLDRFEERYASAGGEVERAELICALVRQERSRRNGFLNQAKADGVLVAQAVERVLQGKPVWEGVADEVGAS